MNKGVEKWLRSICTHIFLALGIKVCVMLGLSLLIKLMLIDQHKGGFLGIQIRYVCTKGIKCKGF